MRPIDADAFEVSAHERYCAECDNYAGLKCRACWVDDMLGDVADATTLSPDEVRGVGEWEDNYPILVELECLRCKNCNKLVQIGRYCANCGERKKGAETWIKKKSRSQST